MKRGLIIIGVGAQMRKLSCILAVIGSALFSLEAQARAGWTDAVQVAELVPTARHYYEVKLPITENPSGCREKNWFYQNYGATGSEQMFDVLLKGVTSDIRLRVYVTGLCNINGYAEFSSVNVIR